MTKTQENNLCRDIGRIARSLERIARAVEKPDGGEKTEVIRCKDCKHYIRHDKRCGYWNHGVKPDMWCCQAERREDG